MNAPDASRQLPRGRHGLSREEVESSQRVRMLVAMGHAVAEKTYAGTSVADVIRRAGVSRETFYEHFANKEECFLAAVEAGVEDMLATMGAALGAVDREPVDRLDSAIGAYLDKLAAAPAFARTFLIEAYGAGPRSLARRVELQERFVDTVAAVLGAQTDEERFACEAFVAAVSMMVTVRVGTGAYDELPALREPIVALVRRALQA